MGQAALFANTVDMEESAFAVREDAIPVCQLDLDLPKTSSQWRAYRRDERVWAAQMLRKSEVKWSALNASEKELFQKGKNAGSGSVASSRGNQGYARSHRPSKNRSNEMGSYVEGASKSPYCLDRA